MEKRAEDLVAGDTFLHEGHGWTAIEDAEHRPDEGIVVLKVRYVPDGGIGYREWDYGTLVSNINERNHA